MKIKIRKPVAFFIVAAAFIFTAVCVYGVIFVAAFFEYAKPTMQILNNPTQQQAQQIALTVGIDPEHKIIYVEKINAKNPVIIVWIPNEYGPENSGLYLREFNRSENVHKYDPLSRIYVKGSFYKKDDSPVTIYMYKNYIGDYVKYQIVFPSRKSLKTIENIFEGTEKYKAGHVDDYDQWRPEMDKV